MLHFHSCYAFNKSYYTMMQFVWAIGNVNGFTLTFHPLKYALSSSSIVQNYALIYHKLSLIISRNDSN